MMTSLRFWWWLMVREPANVRALRRRVDHETKDIPGRYTTPFNYGQLTPTERDYCAWIGLGLV